jgi:4-amino-4-deoxy-L-arabinose transferase-like glycosyltransferase
VAIQRLRELGWSRPARVALPLAAFVIEGWPAFIAALIVQEGGLWLSRALATDCRRPLVSRVFLGAYALRMLIALPAHYVAKWRDGSGALFLDDYTNDLVGEWLVRIGRGDGIAVFAGHQHLLESVYTYVLMGIDASFGYAPLVPKLLNIGLAALSAVLVYEIARNAFRQPVAIIAALGAAALPSMVVWSIVTLKETLVLSLALFGLWVVQLILLALPGDARLPRALVAFLASLALLLDLRTSAAAILLVLAIIAFAYRAHYRPRPLQAALGALAVLVVLGAGVTYARARTSNRPLTAIAEDVMLQIRHRRAQEAAAAGSQLRQESDVYTPTGSELPLSEAASDASPFSVAGDVVEPLGYALLAPAPWQARSTAELAASAEMPVWYVLIAASALAWRASPNEHRFVVLLAMYAVANWLVLAAAEGNVGNLLRHRLLLDPALLILGGAGLVWLWERTGRPFERRLAWAEAA